MGMFDMIKVKISGLFQIPISECLEYHKALRATPHSQVTPIQVNLYSLIYKDDLIYFFIVVFCFEGFINDLCSIFCYTTWYNR